MEGRCQYLRLTTSSRSMSSPNRFSPWTSPLVYPFLLNFVTITSNSSRRFPFGFLPPFPTRTASPSPSLILVIFPSLGHHHRHHHRRRRHHLFLIHKKSFLCIKCSNWISSPILCSMTSCSSWFISLLVEINCWRKSFNLRIFDVKSWRVGKKN